jgi:hypothetical protein
LKTLKKAALRNAAIIIQGIRRDNRKNRSASRALALSTLPLRLITLRSFRCFKKISIGKPFP